jgi:hypothetical protein
MYWVFIIGAWSLIGLLLVAIFWPGMTERLKFFIGTLWVLVTAFAVIAQAVIYRKQWAIMESSLSRSDTAIELTKQSIGFNEKSFEYANRAYVIARIKALNPVAARLDRFYFKLRIENSGNTPANDVRVAYACRLDDKPPCEMIEGQLSCDIGFDLYKRLGVVAPNDSDPFIDTPQIGFESIGQFQLFESEALKFYCWGTIYYEDMFNEPRHSDFCFYQSWSRREGYPCEYGNEVF